MQGKGEGFVKILWNEAGELHCVKGQIVGEDDFFVEIQKSNNGAIRIAKSAIIKIEKLGRF